MDLLQPANSTTGFATLTNVIILGAVGATITTTLLILGTGATRNSGIVEQSGKARSLANACAETALLHIRQDGLLSGTDTITLGQGTCTYAITAASEIAGEVSATGLVGTLKRKIHIDLTTNTSTQAISIGSWQEVADF